MDNLGGSGMPSSINTNIMSLEQLDDYIEQQSHPEIINSLKEMRKHMIDNMPDSEKTETVKGVSDLTKGEPVVESVMPINDLTKPKKTRKKRSSKKTTKKKTQKKNISAVIPDKVTYIQESQDNELKAATNMDFDVLVNKLSTSVYNGEFNLPSDNNIDINLKTMTVEEYKFLSKFIEQGLNSYGDKGEEKKTNYEILKSIDTVLQRCITNDIDINTISIFDWYYLILNLKLMSRGDDDELIIECNNKECDSKINITAGKICDDIFDKADEFIKNPIKLVKVTDELSLYIATPTVNDVRVCRKIAIMNGESKVYASAASYIKGCVSNGTNYILAPEQKYKLFSELNYDTMTDVINIYSANEDKFLECCGLDKCPVCDANTGVECSDFILYFLNF